MTLLEIMHRKKWMSDDGIDKLNEKGLQIAAMIKGLINAVSAQDLTLLLSALSLGRSAKKGLRP